MALFVSRDKPAFAANVVAI